MLTSLRSVAGLTFYGSVDEQLSLHKIQMKCALKPVLYLTALPRECFSVNCGSVFWISVNKKIHVLFNNPYGNRFVMSFVAPELGYMNNSGQIGRLNVRCQVAKESE